MIYSVKYADRTFYSQRNNPIDVYNQIVGKSGYLESCFTSSLTNASIALLDDEPIFRINNIEFQPEQLGWDMLNDQNNWPELQKLRKIAFESMVNNHIVPSRVPQYGPFVVRHLFGLESKFKWCHNSDLFDLMSDNIINGISNVIQLKKPGHYIAVVKYDSEKEELITLDSAYGKYRHLNKEDVLNNCMNFYLEIYPKGD